MKLEERSSKWRKGDFKWRKGNCKWRTGECKWRKEVVSGGKGLKPEERG